MINTLRSLKYAVILGVLSNVLALVHFTIPGVEGGVTGLNEIPLIISVLYIPEMVFLIVTVMVSSIIAPAGGSIVANFAMHLVGVLGLSYLYKGVVQKHMYGNQFIAGVVFAACCTTYYFLLVVPTMVVANRIFTSNKYEFVPFYLTLCRSIVVEVAVTLPISVLYLLLFNSNHNLRRHVSEVEQQIKERTAELDRTVKDLSLANAELKKINDHLDALVFDRTRELEKRNGMLAGYAYVNSHLLRAPLARIIGLSNLIKMEFGDRQDMALFGRLLTSCDELDGVVTTIGRIVSEDTVLDSNNLIALKDKIANITEEITALRRIDQTSAK